MSTPTRGRVLAGRYRLDEPVGDGGVLWRGHDEALGGGVEVRRVEGPADDVERAARVAGARRARDLFVRGVTPVVDVVEEDQHAFVVTEAAPGRALSDLLADSGPLSESAAARLGVHVLDALDPLHAAGLVHGDLRSGTVRIVDGQEVVLSGDALVPAAPGAPQDLPALAAVLDAALPADPSAAFTDVLARLRDGTASAPAAREALLALTDEGASDVVAAAVPATRPVRRRRRALAAVAALAAAALLAAGAVALGRDDPSSTTSPVAGGDAPAAGQREADDPAQEPAAAAPQDGLDAAAPVPAGWSAYEDPNGRYAVGYPPGWERRQDDRGARFVSATGLSSLLVVTRDGLSGAGREQVLAAERAFAQSKRDYRRVRLEERTFRGLPAYELEATFTEGGAAQRATALGFVVDGRGYLLFLQSRARTWDRLTEVQRDLRASFRVPA